MTHAEITHEDMTIDELPKGADLGTKDVGLDKSLHAGGFNRFNVLGGFPAATMDMHNIGTEGCEHLGQVITLRNGREAL